MLRLDPSTMVGMTERGAMKLKTIRDLDVDGKTVLVRVDYNVPLKDGEVDDALRIEASFATINYLLERDCKVILMSHLGRPEGKVDAKYSLKAVAKKASVLLGQKVDFVGDCVGEEVEKQAKGLKPKELLLLENLRFHPEEEACDVDFAKKLASLAEVYVDDAFAVAHHAAASNVQITDYLPSAAGFLIEQEVKHIATSIEDPKRPLLAVIGGAKVNTKADVLDNLLPKVQDLFIGGAMANTFLVADGHNIGKSVYEKEELETVRDIMRQARKLEVGLVLPHDVVVSHAIDGSLPHRTVTVAEVEEDDYIVDLGPKTVAAALEAVVDGGTVIWNGPLGITEVEAFCAGSLQLAEGVMKPGITSIIGGGDTADFVDGQGLHDKFTFVSTGGGASLELMAGKELPGLEVLKA
jgi:3-phosphoglycerate kinase